MISKELLSDVLNINCTAVELPLEGNMLGFQTDNKMFLHLINIHELAHKCILYAWENNYEITPRVMGAEIMCLKLGYQEHIVQREGIEDPEKFDPRFTFKACEWVMENKDE